MARVPFLPKRFKPAGATKMVPLDQVLQLLEAQERANSDYSGESTPTRMPTPNVWGQIPFGPGSRIPPEAITPLRRDTNRAEPSQYEYPVAWNLQLTQVREIPWHTLRAAAKSPLVRPIIRKRQRDLTKLPWDIAVKRSVIEEAARQSGDGSANAASKLAKSLAPQISAAREFWENPDPANGLDFADWYMALIEDQLVLDAVAIYPETTYDGSLYGLRSVDGSTIKPLLNEYGRRPTAPYPAFQQILYGFPRGEFTADVGVADPDVYTSDQLIYRRQFIRNFSPYGQSPVETALLDIDLFLRRHGWMRSEYTEGTLAEAYLKTINAEQSNWSPQQLLEYERELNDSMSGSTAERHRMRMLPPGWEPVASADASERYKADYDLYIIQLVASHFGERAERLGFNVGKGVGGSGVVNQSDEVSAESGLFPDAKWWMRQFTHISHRYLGMPKELEFRFLDVEQEDLGEQDEMGQNRVQSGRVTYNEERDRLGLPRYTDPLADIPVIVSRKGLQPLTMAGIALGAGVAPPGAPGAPLNEDGSANTNAPHEQAQLAQQASAPKNQADKDSALEGQTTIQPNAKNNPNRGSAPGVLPALPTKPSRQGEITPPGGSNAASEAARALANHRHAKAGTAVQKDARAEHEIAMSEVRAYRNWLSKGTHSRDFEFESDPMLVRVLDPSLDFTNAVFKHAADAPAHAVRHDVHAMMSESFPPEAIDWVKHADWSGPEKVPAEKIDLHDQNSWAAQHDPDKVKSIAKRLRKGKSTKPMVVIKVKGKNRFITVDGHHHLLGSIKAGVIPTAYVGEIDPQYLTAALETHTHQFPKNDH